MLDRDLGFGNQHRMINKNITANTHNMMKILQEQDESICRNTYLAMQNNSVTQPL